MATKTSTVVKIEVTSPRLPGGVTWCDISREHSRMESTMISMKFSANVPEDVLNYVDEQVSAGLFPSRSAALTDAIRTWRDVRLEDEYAVAFTERDSLWDEALSDGLIDRESE